jgi:hypothetical protein
VNQKATEYAVCCTTSDTSMGAIRKSSTYSSRRPDFRKQLQRALSLSSSESEDIHGAPKSSTGDTTEDQQSVLSKSHGSSVHSDSVDPTYDKQIDPELFPTAQTAGNFEQVTDLPRDRDMIALECVAE